MGLHAKWIEGTLSQEDVKAWLVEQTEIKDLGDEELNHVAMCLHHLYLWHKEDLPVGHFLSAVLKNDFMEACGRADNTNKKVLPIYAMFLYNYAPIDYKTKAKEQFGERR